MGEVVGRDGRTRERVKFAQPVGAWGEMESSVNALIDDLVWPINEVTRALSAVARGNVAGTWKDLTDSVGALEPARSRGRPAQS